MPQLTCSKILEIKEKLLVHLWDKRTLLCTQNDYIECRRLSSTRLPSESIQGLYALRKSIFVKYFAPLTCSKILEIKESAYMFLIVTFSNHHIPLLDEANRPFSSHLVISNVEWIHLPSFHQCMFKKHQTLLVTNCRLVPMVVFFLVTNQWNNHKISVLEVY